MITVIGAVSCFILCNEGKEINRTQKTLIQSLSSTSALNNLINTNPDGFIDREKLKAIGEDPEMDDDDQDDQNGQDDAEETGDYGGLGYRVTLEGTKKLL